MGPSVAQPQALSVDLSKIANTIGTISPKLLATQKNFAPQYAALNYGINKTYGPPNIALENQFFKQTNPWAAGVLATQGESALTPGTVHDLSQLSLASLDPGSARGNQGIIQSALNTDRY